ncbi:hypothetical protein N8I77_000802 [Diaporthe amygdali]|uniref:SnoaL-like domain-containing protein n=1 Tax=Phomopsis amygdali TaxID=1214568 RepID=A0AAD9W7K0_PHOAM|nr:hypothetical protein N8I77_000802 [Diaporthe amygdali]
MCTEIEETDARGLAELSHPMNYTNLAFEEQKPANAEERQAYLYDRKIIEDLISEYNYRVDASLAKTPNYGALDKLFTHDAEVTFPRGKYQGNAGLGEWLMSPFSALHRMAHLSSNHSIKFESSTIAHGRSAWQSTAGLHATDITKVFFSGGFYYWSFRKMAEEWRISFLLLDMNWRHGDITSKPAK